MGNQQLLSNKTCSCNQTDYLNNHQFLRILTFATQKKIISTLLNNAEIFIFFIRLRTTDYTQLTNFSAKVQNEHTYFIRMFKLTFQKSQILISQKVVTFISNYVCRMRVFFAPYFHAINFNCRRVYLQGLTIYHPNVQICRNQTQFLLEQGSRIFLTDKLSAATIKIPTEGKVHIPPAKYILQIFPQKKTQLPQLSALFPQVPPSLIKSKRGCLLQYSTKKRSSYIISCASTSYSSIIKHFLHIFGVYKLVYKHPPQFIVTRIAHLSILIQ
eukprot:TRINITY_DN38739_c0_g4_i2.p1 TRINITY_DN38739_c0_g4~~TRINITY_DN38739_c0_g4_i2.p1  ORF type:complete len:271 (+),score=-31.87 TRINITY_DN38739_c0_g4_i2:154-966(+)